MLLLWCYSSTSAELESDTLGLAATVDNWGALSSPADVQPSISHDFGRGCWFVPAEELDQKLVFKMSKWKRCNLYQNQASSSVSSSSISKVRMSFLLLWAFCLCMALALPTVLLGQVDIWLFFTTKLLWWSSDFSSACMKWKAYQDLPIESQQNVHLWYQWAYAFLEFVHFQLDVILLFSQQTSKCFFSERNPLFFFFLSARNYLHLLSPGSAAITDWGSSEFELTL